MKIIISIFIFYNFLFANLSDLEKVLNSDNLIEKNSTKRVYIKPFNFKCSEVSDRVNCISGEVISESNKTFKNKKVTTLMSMEKISTQFKSPILNIKSKQDLSQNLTLLNIKNFNYINKENNDTINIKEATFNNNFTNEIYPLPIIGKFGIEIKDMILDIKSDKLENNNSLNIIYNLANFLIKDREKVQNSLNYILKHSPKNRYIKIIKDKIPINIDISIQNRSYDKNKIISNLKFIVNAKIFNFETILNLTLTSNDNFKNLAENKKIKKENQFTNDLIIENLTITLFDREGLKEHNRLLQKDKKYKESIENILNSLNNIDSKIYQNSKEAINNLFLGKSDKLTIFINNKYEILLSEFIQIGVKNSMKIALNRDKSKIVNSIEELIVKYFDIQIVNSEKDIVIKKFDLKDKPAIENLNDNNITIPNIPIEQKDISPAIRFDYTLFHNLKFIKKNNQLIKIVAKDKNISTTIDYFLNLKNTNGLLFFNLSDKAVNKIFNLLKNKKISIDIERLNKNYPLQKYKTIYKMGQFIEPNVFLINGKIEHLKKDEYKINIKKLKKYEWYKLEFIEKIK